MSRITDIRESQPLAAGFVPRVVVIDLDGTTIDYRQRLHPRIRDAVRSVATHVPVIVATGRMYRSSLPWAVELGVHEPLVCYQGAMVREMPQDDGSPGQTIFEQPLRPAPARKALDVARAAELALPGVPERRAALRTGPPRGVALQPDQRRAVPARSGPGTAARARDDEGRMRHRRPRRGGSRDRGDDPRARRHRACHAVEPGVRRDPRR